MKSGCESKEKLNEMETTAQRLSQVYCRPTTEDLNNILAPMKCEQMDTHVLVGYVANRKNFALYSRWVELEDQGRTEISVPQFIHIIQDSLYNIDRLSEDGFIETDLETCIGYESALPNGVTIQVTQGGDVSVIEGDGFRRNHILFQGVKNYTQMLTLIELIG